MPEHTGPTIHIGQLNLRIQGDGAEAGRRTADGVVRSLTRGLAWGLQARLGAVSIRVRRPAGTSEPALSEAVGEAILQSVRHGSRKANGRR